MATYTIGVAILLEDGISAGLAAIGAGLVGLEGKVNRLRAALGGVHANMLLMGAGGIMVGGLMARELLKVTQHGQELLHQMELMKIAGMSNLEIEKSLAEARRVSTAVPTSTPSENLKSIRELRMAFGDTADAQKYLEDVRRSQMVVNTVLGKEKGDQVWEQVKALEMKGTTMQPEHFKKMLDEMTSVMVASGGKVTAADFFSAFKYGRTAMLGWDDTFVQQYLPTLMQEMKTTGGGGGGGVGGPGNALMSMFQAIVGGQMRKTSAEEFRNLGLLQDRDYKPFPGTAVGKVSPYGVTGTGEFIHNPYQWVQDVLKPALEKAGFDTTEKKAAEIARLFGTRTASQIATIMATQTARMEKDAELIRNTWGTKLSAEEILKHDPTAIMAAFHAQWERLLQALGIGAVGPAMEGMRQLTGAITGMAQIFEQHPHIAAGMMAGAATVAATLVTGAAAALIKGALRGLGVGVASGAAAAAGAEAGAVTAAGTAAGATLVRTLATGLVAGLATIAAIGVGKMVGDEFKKAFPALDDSKRLDERAKAKIPESATDVKGPTGAMPDSLHRLKAHLIAIREFEQAHDLMTMGGAESVRDFTLPSKAPRPGVFDDMFKDKSGATHTGVRALDIASGPEPLITPKIDTAAAASKVKTDIEGVKPIVKTDVNADTTKLKAQIEAAVKGPFTVNLNAALSGMPNTGGGGGGGHGGGGHGGSGGGGGGGGGGSPTPSHQGAISGGTKSAWIAPAQSHQKDVHVALHWNGHEVARQTVSLMNDRIRMATQGAVHPDTTRYGPTPVDTASSFIPA